MTCIMRFKRPYISISMCHMVAFWPKNFTQDCFLRFALILCVGATQCVSNTSGGVEGGDYFLLKLALIVWPPKINIPTCNNIDIKAFLATPVYSIVELFTSIGSFTHAHNVLYMLFLASCIHSLKKSQ